jgi:hypothetical protein
MATTTKMPKIPKSLAAAADLYYSTREMRLKLEREAEANKDFENQLKDHLINSIPKSDATGIAGKLCRVSVQTKPIAQVADWEKFYAHVAKNRAKGSFALLNKAVNQKAVKEVWDAGKSVPGVEVFNSVVLSVNKV